MITPTKLKVIKSSPYTIEKAILERLDTETPRSVKELVNLTGKDHTSIIRALRVMRKRGQVWSCLRKLNDTTAHGQELNYYLNDKTTT